MHLRMKEEYYPIADLPFFMNSIAGRQLLLPPLFYNASCLLSVRKGSVTVFVGTGRHTLSAGDLLYIPEKTVFYAKAEGGAEAAVRRLVFRPEGILADMPEFERGLFRIRDAVLKHKATLYAAESTPARRLNDVVSRISDEWQTREIYFSLAVTGALCEAIALILRDFADTHYTEERTAYKNILRLTPALRYIEENAEKKIMLPELANATGLTADRVEKLFREALDFAPTEYMLYIRMNRALCRLVATEDSVARLSRASGFSSGTYFARCFARDMEMSPREFRALLTENR